MNPNCSCPETQEYDGRLHVVVLDPDCKLHSFPRDEWRAGSPLRRHALVVDRETGDRMTIAAARERCKTIREIAPGLSVIDSGEWLRRFRDETPREVTARLMMELAA